ncbi:MULTISPECIES: hypothetical protein [unclassified Microbacterium]|uniref:hypothetical protein n=1 Tax=unclassified Microbacterium TaxID=2609290 RepID=UPI002883363E|nr:MULTISPECIES: hypothetical protein [unclassified Microbacterium]
MKARNGFWGAAGAVVLVLTLTLTGCAGPDTAAEATPTPSESNSSRSTATPRPSATPTATPKPPTLKTVTIECRWQEPSSTIGEPAEYKMATYTDVHDAWARGIAFSGCDAAMSSSGVYSTDEIAAVTVAYPEEPLPEKVKTLWGICAETSNFYQTNGPINQNQSIEAAGALMLCPDHPSAAIMANGSQEQQERNNGLRFGSGVFEVNTKIQPGTYRASGDIQNCYWERLDSAGEIIANNFVSAATQVEVTVQASDFSVHFTGCGEFVKVG